MLFKIYSNEKVKYSNDSKSQTILNAYDWYMSNDMKSIEEIYSQDA